jgi:L-seryl-tRNA(Ser) seleniumtransferase
MADQFRNIPSVDRLISDERIKRLEKEYSHDLVLELARQHLSDVRVRISQGKSSPSFDQLIDSICNLVESTVETTMRPVINATGVILHTNLGRSPISHEATAAVEECARRYVNLEIDLDTGRRGSRQVHVESLLCRLTGAEAALVVNNNASAVLLALSALAKRKEVIVSRGQAVEIGGGFRVPDVMRQSGAKLVEVGTTNRTYLTDYETAITPRTAALLRVHSSNFKVIGFTESVSLEELIQLGARCGVPVLDDLGSGCLLDTARFGLDPEPMMQRSVAAGVGLAMSSADKLLGGPQAGLLVGRNDLVTRLRKHPLARAIRIDKVRMAGLVVTLRHYIKGEAEAKIPIWRMISAPLMEIERRSYKWQQSLGSEASVIEGESMVGGGSLPGGTLPTRLVAIKPSGKVKLLADRLRSSEPIVIGRVENDLLLLDPRTVLPEEDDVLIGRVRDAITQ